ncbi:MAG: phage tail protein [Pseudomonas sp.]|nr:phage tail protein [Pseudomonas sp.]
MNYPNSVPGVGLVGGKFTDGNPLLGQPASLDPSAWANQVTDELLNVIAAAGIAPSEAASNQLLLALRAAGVFTTPQQFDTSTKAATMEALQRALGNFASASVLSAATTLIASDAGKAYSLNPGSSLVLPLFASVPKGASFFILNADGAASKTITRQGADTMFAPDATNFPSSAVSSITLLPGEWVCITANSQWQVIAGSVWNRVSSGPFGASLGPSGYQKLPSGKIRQWGVSGVIPGGTNLVITLPIAAPIAIDCVNATFVNEGADISAGDYRVAQVRARALTSFTLRNLSSTASQFFWEATCR